MQEFLSFFAESDLTIPAAQMFVYVVLINVFMLLGRYRLCYLLSLSFAFYWLFWLNKEVFVNAQGDLTGGIFYYLGAGLVFLIAIFISFSSMDKE